MTSGIMVTAKGSGGEGSSASSEQRVQVLVVHN